MYVHILVAFIIIYKDLNGPLTHKSDGIYICPARCDFLFVSNCKFDKFPPCWSLYPARPNLPAMWMSTIQMSRTRTSSWPTASNRACCTKMSMRRRWRGRTRTIS